MIRIFFIFLTSETHPVNFNTEILDKVGMRDALKYLNLIYGVLEVTLHIRWWKLHLQIEMRIVLMLIW